MKFYATDEIRAFYEYIAKNPTFRGKGDFINWGYWQDDIANAAEASENLVEIVTSFIKDKTGTVLDVGCGIGGVSKYLTRWYPASSITGITVVDSQVEICRSKLPGATFLNMDATDLKFAEKSFDAIVCVEAALHFNTRQRFFQEAERVLKPGGMLVFSDILLVPGEVRDNIVADPAAYAEQLRGAGFREVRVEDVTEDTAIAFANYGLWWLHRRRQRGEIDDAQLQSAVLGRLARLAATRYYVVGRARKPVETPPHWRAECLQSGQQNRDMLSRVINNILMSG